MGTVRQRLVLTTVCAALLVVVIDITVLHTAIPALSEALEPTPAQLLWIVDVYPLVVAPLLISSGLLGDRWGRKKALLVGVLVFGVASTVAAFARAPEALILARAVMGVGAALIMPATMSIVRVAFPDRAQRLRAVAIWSAVSACGAAVGPLIGGILVQTWSWGAVFLVNVPLCVVVFVFGWIVLHESRSGRSGAWDGWSVLASIVAVLSISFSIKEFAAGQSLLGVIFAVAAGATSVFFVRRQLAFVRRGLLPMVNVQLFRSPAFTVAVCCVMLSMFGIVGLDLIFAQYLQHVLGFSPVEAAVRLLPLALATVAGSLCSAYLVNRWGQAWAIRGGLAMTTVALIPLLLMGPSEQFLVFSVCLAGIGFALEIALVAANDTILSAAPADRAGELAGIEESAYDLGGGLGIAVLGSISAAVYTASFRAVPGLNAEQLSTARSSVGNADVLARQLDPEIGERAREALERAFVSGFHAVVLVSIIVMGSTFLLAAIVTRRTSTAQPTATQELPG